MVRKTMIDSRVINTLVLNRTSKKLILNTWDKWQWNKNRSSRKLLATIVCGSNGLHTSSIKHIHYIGTEKFNKVLSLTSKKSKCYGNKNKNYIFRNRFRGNWSFRFYILKISLNHLKLDPILEIENYTIVKFKRGFHSRRVSKGKLTIQMNERKLNLL